MHKKYRKHLNTYKLEIIKESWNKYQLADNTVLNIRIILESLRRTVRGGLTYYEIDTVNRIMVKPDPDLVGDARPNRVSADEISRNIEIKNMDYNILRQGSSRYLLNDGTKIKIHLNVTSISRSSLKDQKGNPTYHVTSSNTVWFK